MNAARTEIGVEVTLAQPFELPLADVGQALVLGPHRGLGIQEDRNRELPGGLLP